MSLDDELRAAFLTEGLSDSQRAEFLAVGTEVAVEAGEIVQEEGDPAEYLWMFLEGEAELTRRIGSEVRVLGTMRIPGLWTGGFTAWGEGSDAIGYRATVSAVTRCRFFRVPSDDLRRLVEAWFPLGKHLIAGIFQNVRGMEATVRERESLIALGTMAAGLAHEINNPAAAARRAVDALRSTGDAMVGALTAMATASITADQYQALEELRATLMASTPAAAESPLAIARREDAIGDRLASAGIENPWHLAALLAGDGLDLADIDRIEAVVGRAGLAGALGWVTSIHEARQLLDQLGEATERISALVGAVRSFSQMDRASLQRVDVHEGIESTLMILGHKLRDVTVERRFASDLPDIEVSAAELNQVWANLIDNAVDAMDGHGTLTVATRMEDGRLVVEISDTGAGMPPDVLERAFDPFFTTKDVGKGTGLGLDISRRIVVERHGGEITFDTSAAGTTAHVALPLER